MKAVILTQDNFDIIQQDLSEIKTKVKNLTAPMEHFIDNITFMELMGISVRTAQLWRDEGVIGYSKQGKKIYYRMSDIERFLAERHKEPVDKDEGKS